MKEKWYWRLFISIGLFLMGVLSALAYILPKTLRMPKVKEEGDAARKKEEARLETLTDSAVVSELPNAADVRATINDPAPAGDAKVHGDRWGTGSIFPGK
jgi:hypothetical protein